MTTHRHGFLAAQSTHAADLHSMQPVRCDVAIVCSGWDSRSAALAGARFLEASHGIALRLRAGDGSSRSHDDKVLSYLNSVLSRPCACVLDCRFEDAPQECWRLLKESIASVCGREERPLSVFVDMAALPVYLLLALLAWGFRTSAVHQFVLFYIDGKYQVPSRRAEFSLRGGTWRSMAVPGLEGQWSPALRRYYFASVGFEGYKTFRAIERDDPDRLSVLFPRPGLSAEYERATASANRELLRRFRVPPRQIVDAPAGDAVGAWAALEKAQLERVTEENSYYLCCGTKPHAVAQGLRAISLGYPAVMYFLPEDHRADAVEPAASYWMYEVRDVCAVPGWPRRVAFPGTGGAEQLPMFRS